MDHRTLLRISRAEFENVGKSGGTPSQPKLFDPTRPLRAIRAFPRSTATHSNVAHPPTGCVFDTDNQDESACACVDGDALIAKLSITKETKLHRRLAVSSAQPGIETYPRGLARRSRRDHVTSPMAREL
jgi:hypothetical protein